MEYRSFGETGINISAIGFGCWEIGGGYGSIEENAFIEAINRALDVGINSFDTAEAYGMGASETSLAKALGSRRQEAVITTKFGVGYPDFPNFRDSSRKRVMESIEKSLKALNTDYVDVYLIRDGLLDGGGVDDAFDGRTQGGIIDQSAERNQQRDGHNHTEAQKQLSANRHLAEYGFCDGHSWRRHAAPARLSAG